MTNLLNKHILRPAFLLAVIFILALTTGCGRKGPLKPKLLSQPVAPYPVSLRQQGDTLMLSWTLPEKNQDGSAAEGLVGFGIRRLVYPADESCPTCREPQEKVADLDKDYPEPGQRIGKRYYWRDTDVSLGYGYRYAIVPLTLGWNSGDVAYVNRTLIVAPPAPTDLHAEPGDQRVELSWQPPALAEGMTLIGYNLYRREAGKRFWAIPLNKEPLPKDHLIDRGLHNGQAYEYRISTLVESNGQQVESFGSQSVLITPQDQN